MSAPAPAELEAVCPLCGQTHRVRMESVACNLCGQRDPEELFRREDLALGLGGTFRVVRCRRCGLAYLDPRPAPESIAAYYPAAYAMHRETPDDRGRSRLGAWRLNRFQDRRCRLVSRHRRSGRVLDVGCADGHFLRRLRASGGWEAVGVELVPRVAARARERHGLDVRTGRIEDADLPAASFDVITLWDVLEHLHDPSGTLARLATFLKPGGLLVLSTPVSDSIDARLFGRYWIGYEVPRHLYFFSRRTVAAMLHRAGFAVRGERVLFGSDLAFADEMRFWLRGRGLPRAACGAAAGLLRSPPVRWALAPLFKALDLARWTTPRTLVCEKER